MASEINMDDFEKHYVPAVGSSSGSLLTALESVKVVELMRMFGNGNSVLPLLPWKDNVPPGAQTEHEKSLDKLVPLRVPDN